MKKILLLLTFAVFWCSWVSADEISRLLPAEKPEQAAEEIRESQVSQRPTEQKTEYVPSPIEQVYQDIGIDSSKGLRQFGYELFGAWSPAGIGPIDRNYVIGPGDTLRVYIWGDPVEFGELQSIYEVAVAEDGRLFFPPLGRLSVWGSTIGRVTEVVTDQLKRRFRNFQVDIVPAEVRQIPVFVSGFVRNPGVVTATSLWNVLDILSEAGGVSREGSLRDIRIMRRDGSIVKADLYDIFIFGRGQLPVTQEGDVIIVPPVGTVAASGGEVVRPGIYELADGETIEDLLLFSGGVSLSGSREKGTLLRRTGDGYSVSEGSILSQDFLGTQMHNGDLLLFSAGRSARADLVSVKGHVLFPGVYSLQSTQFLSELLEKARIRPDTDLEFGTIVRMFPESEDQAHIVFKPSEVLDPDSGKDIRLNFMDYVELYRKEVTLPKAPIQVFGDIPGGITAFREGISLLDVLANRNVTNPSVFQARIIRDGDTFDIILLRDLLVRADMTKNIKLKPGDKVVVVRNEAAAYDDGSIKILGSVAQPGVFQITPGMRLSDALEKAGGFGDLAYSQGMVIIRESVRKEQTLQFQRSAAQLERQIDQLSEAIAVKSISADLKVSLQNQILQQRTILDLAYEISDDMFGRIALGIGTIDDPAKIRGTVDDIILEDGDSIFVPKVPGYVSVMGDINSGLAVPYDPDRTVRSYLNDVGSIDTRNHVILIVRMNGKIIRGEKTFFGGTTLARETLQPGDIVFAQREIKIPSGISFKNSLLEVIGAVGNISSSILVTLQLIDAFN